MTFEDIQKANESIQTIPIKNKEYAQVNQRIKAFRMLNPNGAIQTSIEKMEDGVVVMTAEIFDENGHFLGSGTAYEKEGSSQINRTSYIENCETSAVGRALGMCGFGIDTSIASAEEMENAINQQTDTEELPVEMIKTLEACIPKHGATIEGVCKYYKVKELKNLTVTQFKDCMNKMGEKG